MAVVNKVSEILTESKKKDKIVIFSYFKATSEILKKSIEDKINDQVLLMDGTLLQK